MLSYVVWVSLMLAANSFQHSSLKTSAWCVQDTARCRKDGSHHCGGDKTSSVQSSSARGGTVYLARPSPSLPLLPACGISRAAHLCFSPSVRTTLKCCFRYPWVSPIKAAPSPQRYCFLRMIDWWMRADTSMKPFPLASLSDDVQRIFSIHASLLACVIPGTSFTPCSLKDLF